jgi:membrane-associated phospholipid phosphatase
LMQTDLSEARRHVRAAASYLSLGVVAGIIAVLILAAAFAKLSDDVIEKEHQGLDNAIALAIHATASPQQTAIMLVVTNFGQLYLIGLAAIAFVVGVVVAHRERLVARFGWLYAIIEVTAPLVAVGGAVALSQGIKALVGRHRPDLFPPLTAESGPSFPSGHTLASVAFYGMCAFLIARAVHGWARLWVSLGAVVMVAAVAYSRVYLGVHYPTDVLGSLILGAAWLIALILTLTLAERRLQQARLGTQPPDKPTQHE